MLRFVAPQGCEAGGRPAIARWVAVGALASLAGCVTLRASYDPRHFADWPIDPAKKVDGCATILTAPEEDEFHWRGDNRGYTLELPLGRMTREAAVRVFGDLFRGGIQPSHDRGAIACRAVVSPRVTRCEWKRAGFVKNTFELSVSVDARSGTGNAVLQQTYDSGQLDVRFTSGWEDKGAQSAEARSAASLAQLTLQRLMLRAAADLKAELERAPPSGAP